MENALDAAPPIAAAIMPPVLFPQLIIQVLCPAAQCLQFALQLRISGAAGAASVIRSLLHLLYRLVDLVLFGAQLLRVGDHLLIDLVTGHSGRILLLNRSIVCQVRLGRLVGHELRIKGSACLCLILGDLVQQGVILLLQLAGLGLRFLEIPRRIFPGCRRTVLNLGQLLHNRGHCFAGGFHLLFQSLDLPAMEGALATSVTTVFKARQSFISWLLSSRVLMRTLPLTDKFITPLCSA